MLKDWGFSSESLRLKATLANRSLAPKFHSRRRDQKSGILFRSVERAPLAFVMDLGRALPKPLFKSTFQRGIRLDKDSKQEDKRDGDARRVESPGLFATRLRRRRSGTDADGKVDSLIGLSGPFINMGTSLQGFERKIGAQFPLLMEIGGSVTT
jgi:hypothetical protein